ncbi:Protoheme IX farnesyltransferase, mitochondrial, partial [Ascosphaera acerosa]
MTAMVQPMRLLGPVAHAPRAIEAPALVLRDRPWRCVVRRLQCAQSRCIASTSTSTGADGGYVGAVQRSTARSIPLNRRPPAAYFSIASRPALKARHAGLPPPPRLPHIRALSWYNARHNHPPATAFSFAQNIQPEKPARPNDCAVSEEHTTTRTNANAVSDSGAAEAEIRPDASARLSNRASQLPKKSMRRQLAAYLALTKPHLSFLVVLTATTAYGLFPTPTVLQLDLDLDSAMTQLPTLSTSTLTFCYLGIGTFLTSASAATLNMLFEPEHDSKMSRTRNRPLVRGLMSKRAALIFAAVTGALGLAALYNGTNPTVAALGATNLVLYAFVYTPLKKVSVLNTWVGAVVGGIPPLMGWTAAAGQVAATGHDGWRELLLGPGAAGGWLLAAILYAWQFPHFNALAWNIREEYKRAGSRMLAWTNPAMNARVALRYSLLMFPLCAGLWLVGVVNGGFLVVGTAVNTWMAREAFLFWKLQGAQASARGLFWASIWHLLY